MTAEARKLLGKDILMLDITNHADVTQKDMGTEKTIIDLENIYLGEI